jgi:hypothetical protein
MGRCCTNAIPSHRCASDHSCTYVIRSDCCVTRCSNNEHFRLLYNNDWDHRGCLLQQENPDRQTDRYVPIRRSSLKLERKVRLTTEARVTEVGPRPAVRTAVACKWWYCKIKGQKCDARTHTHKHVYLRDTDTWQQAWRKENRGSRRRKEQNKERYNKGKD